MKKIFNSIRSKVNFSKKGLFAFYCLSLGLIGLVEGVMGYYFPIQLERSLGSNLSTGLVIGLANIAALTCDFLIPELFKKRSWKFLFLMCVIFQIGFPGFTQLSVIFQFSFLLVIAALFWNVYYEFMAFSRHSFIISNEKKDDYSRDWGVISVICGLTAIVGPLIGSQIVEKSVANGTMILFLLEILAVFSVLTLIFVAPEPIVPEKMQHHRHIKLNILKDFKIWEILGHRILPILVLGSMLTVIFSSVTTVGGLFGEEVFGAQGMEWLLIFVFNAPTIFISLILSRITVARYKKKISQACLAFAGSSLLFLPFVSTFPWAVMCSFFFASIFVSIAWIFNEAVFSDLSKRSGENRLYISSMERMNESTGYFIGPILIGVLADQFGYFIAFEIVGAIAVVLAMVLMFVTPKKLRIPHQ